MQVQLFLEGVWEGDKTCTTRARGVRARLQARWLMQPVSGMGGVRVKRTPGFKTRPRASST
eukprot:scaffold128693_cov68-Phaeocystis_antarctica.AAC.19